MDFTNLSANAFKFGLRGGNASGSMPADRIIMSKPDENLESRSRIRYRHLARSSQPPLVRLRAACRIHASLGLGVIPAT